jgi:hypothetical protein
VTGPRPEDRSRGLRPWGCRPAVLAPLAVVIVLGLDVHAARAQVMVGEPDQYVSPQHFALEFRFGPYKPDIDSEFSGPNARHPYRDFFGPNRRVMSQVEVDYQVLHHVGSLGVGFAAGYFNETGNNPYGDGSGNLSADTSTLRLIPLSLSAVYRFDLMWERWKIPLVPYAKLGFDYVIWTINDGNGDVPEPDVGGKGQGGTWGWHAAAGLSFVLNILDEASARQFDSESGINRTHLFFEWGHWDVSGLGASGKLHVGDDTWTAGMLFEF